MNFVAIDVETANADLSSICQVGISTFRDGRPVNPWKSLVNPQTYFDEINVSIHGIDEDAVCSSPRWIDVYQEVSDRLKGNIVVCHTAFDRLAVCRACDKGGVVVCECRWLDSAKIVRRAWPKFSQSGYGLANVAEELGIKYTPHDALEDARCAGEIVIHALNASGLTLEQWLERVTCPIGAFGSHSITREGNPEGPLFGEVLAFTGALSLLRREAADLAAKAGCSVGGGVTKHTTLLVVGDQDIWKLAGHEKSSKHRKAEELIRNGQAIRILSESDFKKIVSL